MPHPHALRLASLRIGAAFVAVSSGVSGAYAQTPAPVATPAATPLPAPTNQMAPATDAPGSIAMPHVRPSVNPTPYVMPSSFLPTPAPAPAASVPPEQMFGDPPSGEIPVLFNDQHVYTKPDRLRHRRVLAALVRGSTILVPLRSMFEQMGARVSFNDNSRTVDISKPGTDIQLTLGKRAVTINGQETPLDVPAELFRGVIVVPIRVISEGMGAYVQWIPDRHVVVVRYEVAPPAPATATPLVTPLPVPSAIPTAAAAVSEMRRRLEKFVGADYIVSPRVFNELSAGNEGRGWYSINGDVEFLFLGPQWEIGANYEHVRYDHDAYQGFDACTTAPGTAPCNTVVGNDPLYLAGPCIFGSHDPGCVTVPGFNEIVALQGIGQAYVPAFTASEGTLNAHFGIKIADPRIYAEVAYFRKDYNYLGYPSIGGLGFGLDKLPDLDRFFSLYGNAWYFPNVSGTYHYATSTLLGPLSGAPVKISYNVITYDGGGTFSFGRDGGVYIRGGFRGERASARNDAPSSTSVAAPYVGLGIHF